jgi:hypothetical protein
MFDITCESKQHDSQKVAVWVKALRNPSKWTNNHFVREVIWEGFLDNGVFYKVTMRKVKTLKQDFQILWLFAN